MPVCAGIKRTGGRCTVSVGAGQTYCHHHDPARTEERSRAASRAARSKPSREIAVLKEELKALIADVRSGEVDRSDAAVMIQAYRALKDFVALERQIKETDELAAEVAELKREYGVA
jgi:phage I-like protein